jgi:5-methylcytosine-specific restriction endonuclease McrA
MKKCPRCETFKDLNEFGLNKSKKDGRYVYCLECSRIISKEYYNKNHEEKLEREKVYREKNKERNKERNREKAKRYREKYPERVKLSQDKYNKKPESKIRSNRYNHSEKGKLYHRKYIKDNYDKWLTRQRKNQVIRRIRKTNNEIFTISNKDMRRLLSSKCAVCESYDKIHIDHVIPVSRGGRHSIGNLQPLCQGCNLSKNNKLNIEWKSWKQTMKRSNLNGTFCKS